MIFKRISFQKKNPGLCIFWPPALAPDLYLPALAPDLYLLALAPICIYRPWPTILYHSRAWLWPTICIIGMRPEFAFTLLLVVVAVVVVMVVETISLE